MENVSSGENEKGIEPTDVINLDSVRTDQATIVLIPLRTAVADFAMMHLAANAVSQIVLITSRVEEVASVRRPQLTYNRYTRLSFDEMTPWAAAPENVLQLG